MEFAGVDKTFVAETVSSEAAGVRYILGISLFPES